jgi:hypothetical protein
MLGFVAEHIGIRMSYWAVVPIVLAAILAAKSLNFS